MNSVTNSGDFSCGDRKWSCELCWIYLSWRKNLVKNSSSGSSFLLPRGVAVLFMNGGIKPIRFFKKGVIILLYPLTQWPHLKDGADGGSCWCCWTCWWPSFIWLLSCVKTFIHPATTLLFTQNLGYKCLFNRNHGFLHCSVDHNLIIPMQWVTSADCN